MMTYFDINKSAKHILKDDKKILKKVSENFIKNNKKTPFSLIPWYDSGFMQSTKGDFFFDFNQKFPDAKIGDWCYVMAYFVSDKDEKTSFICMKGYEAYIYLNDKLVSMPDCIEEANLRMKDISVHLKEGKNRLFIKVRKNELGFCLRFGEFNVRWWPRYPMLPFAGNEGAMGFAYTRPFSVDIFPEVSNFPCIEDEAQDYWVVNSSTRNNLFKRGYAYLATKLIGDNVCLALSEDANAYLDGEAISFGKNIKVTRKSSDSQNLLVLEFNLTSAKNIDINVDSKDSITLPFKSDFSEKWIFMDGLDDKSEDLIKTFDIKTTGKSQGKTVYLETLERKFSLRIIHTNDIYGKTTYPAGVLIYGMIEAGEYLNEGEILDYACDYVDDTTRIIDEMLYEKERFGLSETNRFITCMEMLDDCGAYGNSIMRKGEHSYLTHEDKIMLSIMEDHILNKQERLPNGMFYRNFPGFKYIDTVWADDLYMSVPFLCRYYKLTRDDKYIDEAVKQVLCFKEYLYINDKKLSSHIFSVSQNRKTGIAWGRGNGWFIFTLTEVLSNIPQNHSNFFEILEFFKEYILGIVSYQDSVGMWHQILDHNDSYMEASCTAIFIYSIAKAVINGWIPKEYTRYAQKGWDALKKYVIDKDGNVYGVCRGSGCSFRIKYYKEELNWRLNDIHGTGLILLAGKEMCQLDDLIKKEN